jgi:uncharacterized protein YpuA (DUF1002 family)
VKPPKIQPALATGAGRQQQRQTAAQSFVKASLAAGASNTPRDAQRRWQELLEQEQALRDTEALMCVVNIRWSTAAWAQLHDRSEQLSYEMAAFVAETEASH